MRRALQISPGYAGAHSGLGVTQLVQGKLDEALASMKQEKVDAGQLLGLSLVYFAMGRKKDSDVSLNAMERSSAYYPSDIARAYAFRGDRERALSYFEKAHASHDPGLWSIKGDPLLKKLAPDPRYKAFLRKLNLPD